MFDWIPKWVITGCICEPTMCTSNQMLKYLTNSQKNHKLKKKFKTAKLISKKGDYRMYQWTDDVRFQPDVVIFDQFWKKS